MKVCHTRPFCAATAMTAEKVKILKSADLFCAGPATGQRASVERITGCDHHDGVSGAASAPARRDGETGLSEPAAPGQCRPRS